MPESQENSNEDEMQFMRLICSNALDWGRLDILAAGSDPHLRRLGRICAYFAILGGENGSRKADAVWVILPPQFERDPETTTLGLKQGFTEALFGISDGEITKEAIADNLSFITPISAVSFDGDALISLLQDAPPKTGFIVVEAKQYRLSRTHNVREVSATEDIWSAHVHQLLVEINNVCVENNSYALLDLGCNLPSRQRNRDLLFSVEDAGVLAADVPAEDTDAVITKVAGWYEAAKAGELGAIILEVEENQDISDQVRILTKLELLSIDHSFLEIQALLTENRRLLEGLSFDKLLHVARIAESAGADDFAESLIRKVIALIRSETDLELALDTAVRVGRKELINIVRSSFSRMFPNSYTLRRYEADLAAQCAEFGMASDIYSKIPNDEDASRSEYYGLLADETARDGWIPTEVFGTISAQMPAKREIVVVDLARVLERYGRRTEAFQFLLQRADELSIVQVDFLIRIAERALQSGEILPSDPTIDEILDILLAHLGKNPSNGLLRIRLETLLSPSNMGGAGFATLVVAVLKRASTPANIRQRPRISDRPSAIALEDVMPRFKAILSWLEKAGFGRLKVGKHTLPSDQLDVPADRFMSALLTLVDHHGAMIRDDADEKVLKMYALVACAVAPLSVEPDEDLIVLRTIGSRLASSGKAQAARDIAEQALELAGKRPERHRQALFTFADIYARLGMRTEALIALGSAYEATADATWDQVWFETNLLFRILRDTGMSELGTPLLDLSRQALDAMGVLDRDGYRVDMFELQAATSTFETRGGDIDELKRLLQLAKENALAVTDQNDDTLPIAMILTALLCLALELQFTETADIEELIEELIFDLPASKKALVRAAGPRPSLEDIAKVASSISSARYVEDTGYDIRHIRVMARRLVQQAIDNVDPESLIYAIEASADRAITVVPIDGETSFGDRLLDKADSPRVAAEKLSRQGVTVFGMAQLAERIATIEFTNGAIEDVTLEPEEIFSVGALSKWSENFPQDYRLEDQELSQDRMAMSVAELGLTKLPKKSIFISDAKLSRLPPNLLRVEGTYAGFSHAIASAPSLEWLTATRALDRKGTGKARMWIPASKTEVDTAALTLMKGDIAEVLNANQIPLETSDQPSENFGKADVAIIAAHGGLAESNRYFRSISDDSHFLKSISEVTGVTNSSRLAILFICSGGRIDPHPETGMAIGLARQFLARGSSAVIAPAWPIPFFIARPWLQGFFEEWNKGEILLDAYHAGNLSVAKNTSWDPKRTLAMSLYGDPFLKIDA